MQSPAVACREIEPPSSSAVPVRKNRFRPADTGQRARQFGEPGIFVAFEENSRHILANAASFGWNLPKLEKKQQDLQALCDFA
jgi:hypothetical protein